MTKASDIRLDGRVAIVTGAAHGLGRAMAQAMVRAGANVVFADIDVGAAGHAVAEVAFRPGAGKALAMPCDITNKGDCERAVAETCRLFGGLHILVNNAGKGPAHLEALPDFTSMKYWETNADMWAKVIETNVVGTYFMARVAAPPMIRGGWGRVINITTSLSTMQRRQNSPYGVSKTAIEAETLIWAQDLEGTGVTCNSLIPGGAVNTDFVSAEGKRKAAASGQPLLEPEVIVPALLWLASSLSDGVNGKRFVGKYWPPEMEVADAVALALEAPVLRAPPTP
jgi:3-oxoacyl-[acyl-carrier protein] reductase